MLCSERTPSALSATALISPNALDKALRLASLYIWIGRVTA